MPGVRDFLGRFRPAGAPGMASGAAVPTDRRADAAAELAGVLAAVAEFERECVAVRDDAARDAAQWTDDAARQASALVARAVEAAAAERAEAAARGRLRVQLEAAEIAAAAAEEAAAVRRDAESRLPVLVARVVERVRGELASVTRDPSADARLTERRR